jgi:hypothetical protein
MYQWTVKPVGDTTKPHPLLQSPSSVLTRQTPDLETRNQGHRTKATRLNNQSVSYTTWKEHCRILTRRVRRLEEDKRSNGLQEVAPIPEQEGAHFFLKKVTLSLFLSQKKVCYVTCLVHFFRNCYNISAHIKKNSAVALLSSFFK